MSIDNSKYTILLVNSSFDKPEQIITPLREARFQITEAPGLQEAIHIAAATPPDLILLDVDKLTQEDTSMIRKLKSNTTTCSIPLLFSVSIANENDIPQYLSYDKTDFVTKPYRLEELLIRIQHQLQLRRAQQTACRQNEKLKETLEAKDKLYGVIAHDLRAPIGTIKMINTLVENQKEKIEDPDIRKWFEMINETTEEAFNLLENLLRWTRNQNGKTKVQATVFSLSKVIRQVVSLFSTIAETKKISLRNHAVNDIYIHADEDMVNTVLRNLVSNAIKFTYPGGQIDITLSQTSEAALVSVKDNGIGIPSHLQTRLLKSNEYITTYGTRNEKGSGLGLILTHDFLKMNKGKCWFSSREGSGTTFYFTLPLAPPENHTASESR